MGTGIIINEGGIEIQDKWYVDMGMWMDEQ